VKGFVVTLYSPLMKPGVFRLLSMSANTTVGVSRFSWPMNVTK